MAAQRKGHSVTPLPSEFIRSGNLIDRAKTLLPSVIPFGSETRHFHANPMTISMAEQESEREFADRIGSLLTSQSSEKRPSVPLPAVALSAGSEKTVESVAADPEHKASAANTWLSNSAVRGFQRLSFTLGLTSAGILPPTNRVSLKVMEAEKRLRVSQNFKYMLHPESLPRFVWDFIIAGVTVALAWRVPYALKFTLTEESTGWTVFYEISDAIYLLDVLLNFRTGYLDDAVIMDPRLVARKYLKGWFAIDLLGSIPMELFFPNAGDGMVVRKAVKSSIKYIKIPKLLRLSRIIKFVQKYLKFVYSIQILFLFISVIHWVACLWVDTIINLDDYAEEDYFTAYGKSLWLALCVMLNMSAPTDVNDNYLLISCLSIFGFVFCTLWIGSIAAVFMNTTSRAVQYQEKVRLVMSDLKALKVPTDLRRAAKSYYDTIWRLKSTSDRYEKAIYDDEDLSPALRNEIALHIHRRLVATVPLFQNVSDSCLACVVMKLRTQLYMRGDVIFHKGDPANAMMIINRGKVKVIMPESETLVAVLKQGSFFGEIGLLRNTTRSCTVIAGTFCELKTLDRSDAEVVFDLYPEIFERLFAEAEKRKADNKQKTQLSNIKVLDNAHAVDANSIDEVHENGRSVATSTFARGGSVFRKASRVTRNGSVASGQVETDFVGSELEAINDSMSEIYRLLEVMTTSRDRLSRLHERKRSLIKAFPTPPTQENHSPASPKDTSPRSSGSAAPPKHASASVTPAPS